MSENKNRWLIALSAVLIHLSIGSVYAYSVYQIPLQETRGWSISEVALAFTVAIFTLGFAAAFLGRIVDRYGPRPAGLIASVFFGGGTVLAGFAVRADSYLGFLFTFGVVAGIGLGLGYVTPISTLVEWFPDRRGLATGMAVLGFGTGALVTGPVANYLIETTTIPTTFAVLGTGYFLAMASGASYLQKPPEGWTPDGMNPDELEAASGYAVAPDPNLEELTASEAVRTLQFYLVWIIMFINISAGIMLLSVASGMIQSITGATSGVAASIVGLMGLFNGAGRIGWAGLSDYLGRTSIFALFFAIQGVSFLLLPQITAVWLFAAFLFLIISCYGGGFASLPAYLGDLFGTKELGTIHGYTLTAWSFAGIAGPTLIARVVKVTGSYELSFYFVAGATFVGLLCVGLLRWQINRIRDLEHHPTHGLILE